MIINKTQLFLLLVAILPLTFANIACGQTANQNVGSASANSFNNSVNSFNNSESATENLLDSAFVKAVKNAGRGDIFKVCSNVVGLRILADYGAMFLAQGVTPPKVCQFLNDAETSQWQSSVDSKSGIVGGGRVELQTAAFDALVEAQKEAKKLGLNISPSKPLTASKRSFTNTLTLWNSRFHPALIYWTKKGKLTAADAQRLRNLPLNQQVGEVLELENSQQIYFSKDFKKSILYSVAAPGTSQHIAMLALDVVQYRNKKVREILADHGWFQTVKSDLPHFTYLGVNAEDLLKLGLQKETIDGQDFWFPNIEN